MTSNEINQVRVQMEKDGFDQPTIDLIAEFAESDTGNQFLMMNAIDYSDGLRVVEGLSEKKSAKQLIDMYMEHMLPAMLKRGCHPVVVGDSIFRALDIVGVSNAEEWDSGALMRYRSRRTFIEIITNPKFAGNHDFKIAALEKTIAYPIEPKIYLSDLRVLFGMAGVILVLLIRIYKRPN